FPLRRLPPPLRSFGNLNSHRAPAPIRLRQLAGQISLDDSFRNSQHTIAADTERGFAEVDDPVHLCEPPDDHVFTALKNLCDIFDCQEPAHCVAPQARTGSFANRSSVRLLSRLL